MGSKKRKYEDVAGTRDTEDKFNGFVKVTNGSTSVDKKNGGMWARSNLRGAKWIEYFKDKRPYLERLLMPTLFVSAGKAMGFQASSTTRHQTVITDTFFDKSELTSVIDATAEAFKPTSDQSQQSMGGGLPVQFYSGTGLTSGSQVYNELDLLFSPKSATRLQVPVMQQRWRIGNTCTHDIHLTIYDFICKQDTNDTPTVMWQNYLTEHNNLAATTRTSLNGLGIYNTNASVNGNHTYTYGQAPRGFETHWKIVNKVDCSLAPGRSLAYTSRMAKKYIELADINNNELTCCAGYTHALIVIMKGRMGPAGTMQNSVGGFVQFDFKCVMDTEHQFVSHFTYPVPKVKMLKMYHSTERSGYLSIAGPEQQYDTLGEGEAAEKYDGTLNEDPLI